MSTSAASLKAAIDSISLPDFNGPIVVGLGAIKPEELKESEQLWIVGNDGNETTVERTLLLLAKQCMEKGLSENAANLLIAGAYVAMKTGNICYDGSNDVPDGKWKIVDKAMPADKVALDALVARAIQKRNIQNAETLIVATKVNWFKQNRHIGKYAMEAIRKVFGDRFEQSMIGYVSRIGLWCSTRSVLRSLGVANIIRVTDFFNVSEECKLQAAPDDRQSVSSGPAGTRRHAIAYELFMIMARTPILVFCPSYTEFLDLKTKISEINASPASFHTCAEYLVGIPTTFNDGEANRFLGRAGAFGKVFIPKSALMKSPHAKNYRSCIDYSDDFEGLVRQYKISLRGNREALKEIVGSKYIDDA